jgi:hypothetical protein
LREGGWDPQVYDYPRAAILRKENKCPITGQPPFRMRRG